MLRLFVFIVLNFVNGLSRGGGLGNQIRLERERPVVIVMMYGAAYE